MVAITAVAHSPPAKPMPCASGALVTVDHHLPNAVIHVTLRKASWVVVVHEPVKEVEWAQLLGKVVPRRI